MEIHHDMIVCHDRGARPGLNVGVYKYTVGLSRCMPFYFEGSCRIKQRQCCQLPKAPKENFDRT